MILYISNRLWPNSKMDILNHPNGYFQDGLATIHNHDFMNDPVFMSAYARGVQATGRDYAWHWRVHVGLWAASVGSKLPGDFVECGVNAGFMSSSIMHHLDWNQLNKSFYLLDTFAGLDPNYVTQAEMAEGILEKNEEHFKSQFYTNDLAAVTSNFSQWSRVKIIQGSVPETLEQVNSQAIAFLHIDMNCALPEVCALSFFWDKLTPGAPVLLDDYAYIGYHQQKFALDELATRLNVKILSLPTGQGLLIKS